VAVHGGGDFEGTTTTDVSGRVPLPSTGTLVETDTVLGPVTLRVVNGCVQGGSVRTVPRLPWGAELNGLDASLRPRTSSEHSRHRFVAPNEARCRLWYATVSKAMELVGSVDPSITALLREWISVVVPVLSPADQVQISSTSDDTIGSLRASLVEDPALMAESFIHEVQHARLHALGAIDDVISGPTAAPRFYSPWREDPRPLAGVLHGAIAFAGVAWWWAQCHGAAMMAGRQKECAVHAHRRAAQVARATDTLRDHAELTPMGQQILGEVEGLVAAARSVPIPAAQRKSLEVEVADRARAWSKQQPASSPPLKGPSPRPSSTASERLVGALGLRGVPLPNVASAQVARRDHTVDVMGSVAVRDPKRWRELKHAIDRLPLDETSSLLRAGKAYVDGDFVAAATAYHRLLERRPSDIDLWNGLASALRSMQRVRAADRVVLGWADVVGVQPLGTWEETAAWLEALPWN